MPFKNTANVGDTTLKHACVMPPFQDQTKFKADVIWILI